jgi:hypothetical protein
MKSKNYLPFFMLVTVLRASLIAKKISHPGSGKKIHPGWIKGVKKRRIPDPQHCLTHMPQI